MPAQVVAKEGRRTHKVVLHRRFQVAIDRAAMKAGLKAASDYIGEWRRDARPCGDDLVAEATAEAERLDREYTKERLAGLIERGGLDDETNAAGAPAALEDA
jgi:hypothetical protein